MTSEGSPASISGSRSFCGGGVTAAHVDDLLFNDSFFNSTMPEMSPKIDGTCSALEGSGSSKMGKRESYKMQRKNYCREKKRVAKELMTTLKDPSIIVMADWLKVRGTLKGWTKFWCVLKPGLLLLYKTPKTHKGSHWIGTVLLNSCEVIERPSKKDGFCFKLFHPLEQSIWASRGNHTMALVQPLPVNYLIFRAPSEPAGKCWMDALELALRCTSLLMRTLSGGPKVFQTATPEHLAQSSTPLATSEALGEDGLTPQHHSHHQHHQSNHWNDSDLEKHFKDHDLDDDAQTDDTQTDDTRDGVHSLRSTDSDSEPGPEEDDEEDEDIEPIETPYVENGTEEFGIAGDAGQTEEVAEENKSLIWSLVKQVRPGMDLSRVVLPTFILEPRSFLDKLSDYYYHADILSKAVQEDDPFTRMQHVVQWYLSGFYKKPKGLKKPYNPILGETFRCYWKHSTGSRTFYISEQVSHHPPVSAFYVTNRQDGFCISGSILAKSKFYGNSLSAILDGTAFLTLLTRGEVYTLTMPYAHCKGILMGTLTMELGGKVSIACEKTGYKTDLEFKLKPFLGGPELCNVVSGKVRLGKEILATIEGHWDGDIFFKDKRSGEETLFWNAGVDTRSQRLKRFTVPLEVQGETESERLWQHVSIAIARLDQLAATEEKTLLEDSQRNASKERQAKMEKWVSRFFIQDIISGEWLYKHIDSRPWDPRNDLIQYEQDYIIKTKTRHRTPIVRTGSIVSMEDCHHRHRLPRHSLDIRHHHVSVERALAVAASRQHLVKGQGPGMGRVPSLTSHGSESSSPDGVIHGSDSTESEGPLGGELLLCPVDNGAPSTKGGPGPHLVKNKVAAAQKIPPASPKITIHQIQEALRPQQRILEDTQQILGTLQHHLESLLAQQRRVGEQLANRSDLTLLLSILVLQVLLQAISQWWWNSGR